MSEGLSMLKLYRSAENAHMGRLRTEHAFILTFLEILEGTVIETSLPCVGRGPGMLELYRSGGNACMGGPRLEPQQGQQARSFINYK